ncbi:hypothetical protein [Petrimonas mucosa]|uniref:hypothetical protein n=1 Tax=Petrimonas mucosa TaxID=1642646 RepID=UPI0012B60190|nr:hypothetical protein [Petrimonas mucosa]
MAVGSVAISSAPALFSTTGGRLTQNARKAVSSNSFIQIALIGKGEWEQPTYPPYCR